MCSTQKPPKIFDDKESNYARYGYISGENGDILAYAKQASEGSFIILNKGVCIRAEHVRAIVPRKFNPNSIVFGFDPEKIDYDMPTLIHWQPPRCEYEYTYPSSLQVYFEVKHLYFNGLHVALSKLSDAGIEKMVPLCCDFVKSPSQVISRFPPYEELRLDSCQQRALWKIMNCSSTAPVLVTGPFGTGKTRLLVRAAYEILKVPHNRVLMCAHHQNSVDTFVTYFGKLSNNNYRPWWKRFVRITLNRNYIDKYNVKYPEYYEARYDLKSINKYDLVITTLGTSHTLLKKNRREFTHILIDEGAQTREPETISPLCFATENTKVIIAGDHLQVYMQCHVFL